MKQFSSKLNTGFIVILVILVLALLGMVGFYNYKMNSISNDYKSSINNNQIPYADTYTFKSRHGFQIELPKNFIPSEETNARGNLTTIMLSSENMINYTNDASNWETNAMKKFVQQGQEKIGENTFNVFLNPSMNATLYWFKKGNEGYMFSGDKNLLKTFKFIGSNDQVYIYKNHGIELELPKRAVSSETKIKDAPIIIIVFEDEELHTTNPLKVVYATDAQWFIQNELRHFNNTGTEKIGTITFNRYTTNTDLGVINSYWYQQGNIGYLLEGDSEILKTFKFVGWK